MIDPGPVPEFGFFQSATIRLISTAYIDEPAMAPLADDESDLALLETVEALTSARRSALLLPSGVRRDELLTERDGYGWTYVNAAFCYTRPTGNRFNGPERGAWYAAWGDNAAETAQAEVSWHLTRELEAVGLFENTTAYRELLAGFATDLHDLRGFGGDEMFDADPKIGYPAGQMFARALQQHGSNGIIYQSVRRAGGFCLAAFRPHVVQNVRQGDTWVFQWAGERNPAITRLN